MFRNSSTVKKTRRPCRAGLPRAVASLVLAVQAWDVPGATACSCAGVPTVEQARQAASVVFSGKVLSREAPAPRPLSDTDTTMVESSGDMIRYRIVPLAIWQGAAADTFVVYSARSSGSCGFVMGTGNAYLLYARRHAEAPGGRDWAGGKPSGPVLVIGSCSRNTPLTNAGHELAALGAPLWRRAKE